MRWNRKRAAKVMDPRRNTPGSLVLWTMVACWIFGASASADLRLTDSASRVYYSAALTAQDEVKIDKFCQVFGDVHSNKKVTLETDGFIEGDVTAAEGLDIKGTIHGASASPVPRQALPVLWSEAEARALADRIYEGDQDFVDATIGEVVFVAGKVRFRGALAGEGTVIATGDIEVTEVAEGAGPDLLGADARLSLIAFKQVKILKWRSVRGALYAGSDLILEKGASLQGVAVAGGKVDIKEGARVEFLDLDRTPPAISNLRPKDGGFSSSQPEVGSDFMDDLSGVDPDSISLVVDGVDRSAEAVVSAAGLSFTPSAPLDQGVHLVELSVVDRSGKATTAAWSFAVDLSRPAVSVVAPRGRVVGESPPGVVLALGDAGSGIDFATLRFTLDEAPVNLACGGGEPPLTCHFATLTPGGHRLHVEVSDRTGNVGRSVADFTYVEDLAPPSLTILDPPPGSLLNERVVRVTGTVSDESQVTLTVNGLETGYREGSFTMALNLPQGASVVRATAVDELGRAVEAEVAVEIDSVPPSLKVVSPQAGGLTNRATVEVHGTASDTRELAGVEIAGQPATLAGSQFRGEVSLEEGLNSIQVRATDAAGNVRQTEVEVTRFSLPEIVIGTPADLSYVDAATTEVSGSVSDPASVVTVNGVRAEVSGTTFHATDVPLIEGGNVLTATSTSSAGRVGTDSVQVVRDLTPPRVTVRYPEPDERVVAESVAVSGMVNDIVAGTVNAAQATVTVAGIAAQVVNRTFFAPSVPLSEGENVLVVEAVDASGNASTASLRVVRDTVPRAVLVRVSGDQQQGEAGRELPQPLVVEARDAAGLPVAGLGVLFKVLDSDGSLGAGGRQQAEVTGADGRADVRFTLGTRAGVGNQVVEAFASRYGAVRFTASAVPGPPALIVVDAGNQQLGTAGQPLPRPLVAAVTDSGANRLAEIPVRFRVVQGDGRFDNDLQEIVVETDGDGRAIVPFRLDPDESSRADVVEAVVNGSDGGGKATFVAYGRSAGDPSRTALTGLVLDNSNQPIPGVTLRVRGTTIIAHSDHLGRFRIEPAPVGTVKLIVDGSTATRPGTWPDLEFTLTTVAGRDNDLGMPIFLPTLNLGDSLVVSETRGGVLSLAEIPGFALEVGPGSVTFPDGSRSGTVSVTVVHSDKVPMVPNFGQQPRLIVTIQPAGARFDPPARLTLPNLEALAPGKVTEMYSFDHDLGHFVSIGPATVSADGLLVVSDPGVGILKAGWHCGGNPSATGTPADCPTCQICDGSVCVPGCSLSAGAVAFTDGSGSDELRAIFAAQCTCDDGDDCTINDRCDGSGGCIGDPVQVTGITGACVAPIGQSVPFNATSNAPGRVQWTASGGTPASGKGGSFSVTYSSAGDFTVVAACKASSKNQKVAVAVDCSSITPVLKEPRVAGTTTNFGQVVPGTTKSAKYKGCVGGGQWCFALEEYLEEHSYVVNSLGRTDVPSATSPVVTPGKCAEIITDLTPPPPGASHGPPRTKYWVQAYTTAHEDAHVTNVKALITDKVFSDLQAFVSNPSNCTSCKSPVPRSMFDAAMNRFFTAHLRAMFSTEEVRAHNVSNAMYRSLIAAIKARARSAPASEGWPPACT